MCGREAEGVSRECACPPHRVRTRLTPRVQVAHSESTAVERLRFAKRQLESMERAVGVRDRLKAELARARGESALKSRALRSVSSHGDDASSSQLQTARREAEEARTSVEGAAGALEAATGRLRASFARERVERVADLRSGLLEWVRAQRDAAEEESRRWSQAAAELRERGS